ncbi:hypothetical protein BG004_001212 [Podila humilis]|nr:hypothetical protein BG004_001212 [Podila humilis]
MEQSSTISTAYSTSDPSQHEMTDITIETQVDPHDESITTTTFIHQPFLISNQCPAPRIISWMKGPANNISKKNRKKQHTHPLHFKQSHDSNNNNSSRGTRLRQFLPFLSPSRRPGGLSRESKKSAGQITVFSIKVTVLGKVIVPAAGDPLSATAEEDNKQDLGLTKRVPAQLVRSETTSYVIHRTFEDFQHLSKLVVALQHQQQQHQHQRRHQLQQDQHQEQEQQEQEQVVLPLRINHPHPGLYQALLKQMSFSSARANQRAFDASSTTHGFDEEGAFERVLEMDSFLEDVWQLLTASASSEVLTQEQYEILQWLKPLANNDADGRQMKDRHQQQQRQQQQQERPKTVFSFMSTDTARAHSDEQQRLQPQQQQQQLPGQGVDNVPVSIDDVTSPGIQSLSEMSMVSSSSTTECAYAQDQTPEIESHTLSGMAKKHDMLVHTRSMSSGSLPSLCTSFSSENGDRDQTGPVFDTSTIVNTVTPITAEEGMPVSPVDRLHRHHDHSMDKYRDSSIVTVMQGQSQDHAEEENHFHESNHSVGELPILGGGGSRGGSRRQTVYFEGEDDHVDNTMKSTKVKRRISLSQVIKSLATASFSTGSGNSSSSLIDTERRKRDSTTSPSSPPSPSNGWEDDLYIWNTVTTKNNNNNTNGRRVAAL